MGTSVNPSSLSPQYQRLIQRTLQVESRPRTRLKQQRQQQQDTKSLVSDLDSKLSSLQSQLGTFTDATSNLFEGRSASAEEGTEAFSVSADKSASPGTHTVSVDRLASADGRVSKQYTADGNSLRNFFDTNGQQTFSVEVATPTDDNPDARTAIDVTVNPTGNTNDEILSEIQSAIDSAMQTAVDDGTISSEERPNASVVNETSDTSRLTLRSGSKGYQGRLGFGDSGDGLLSKLEVNANQVASGTSGGEITEVGTSESSSKLTSKFSLDGLILFRNTNSVTNALDGVTLNLEEANGTQSSFEVSVDKEGAKSAVKELISRYNEVNSFLQEKTKVNPGENKRGALADDSTFRRLDRQLRTDATRPVSGQPDDLNTLADVGIEANRDGSLKLADEEALFTALEENQDAVKQLFSGADGVATRLENRVERFVDTGGLLDDRQDSIDSRVDRLDDRIEQFDSRLERRRKQLRERYAEVQSTIRSLANQQQSISQRLF